jgi:hypothetical protein
VAVSAQAVLSPGIGSELVFRWNIATLLAKGSQMRKRLLRAGRRAAIYRRRMVECNVRGVGIYCGTEVALEVVSLVLYKATGRISRAEYPADKASVRIGPSSITREAGADRVCKQIQDGRARLGF